MASHLQGLSAIASRRRTHNHKWFCKYGSLFDPEIYETAICNVRSRTGRRRKVPGEPDEFAFDTFFEDMVPRIIQQMRDRSFQFMPVQTEPILQPEGKTRLIATPSLVDDVIQEALRFDSGASLCEITHTCKICLPTSTFRTVNHAKSPHVDRNHMADICK